jgi:copper chaperone
MTRERTTTIPQTTEQLTYTVPGMSCGHCRAAITTEVEKVAGVASVDVDLEAKRVTVAGEQLDDAALRAAIDEAGYDVA